MNLLANPCFQIAQRGPSFNLAHSGIYTLDRWVSLADAHSRINIRQTADPLGCEAEFNSAGFGGVWQIIEHDQIASEIGRAKKLAVSAFKNAGTLPMWLAVLAWGGVKDKPTLAPIHTFSGSPVLSAGWSLVACDTFTVGATEDRFALDVPALPAAQNIAVVILFAGEPGDWIVLRDATLDRTADFDGYNYADELRRCSWFYQHYPYEFLMNTEVGFGRSDPGGFISFQFPLSYPLRGRLGGTGVQDVHVDWPVAANGYWHYGGGTYSMFPGSPTLTCHHRHFLLFTMPASGIPSHHATVWRHWSAQPNAHVSFDAELRP